MQINPKSVKKQFEKSLDTYNQNACVQRVMAEKMIDAIGDKYFANILELGSGSGLLTEELVKKIKFDKYFANDLTEKSEKYIKQIIPTAIFYHGNAQKIRPTQKMDLIISNAMFQWFKNLETVSSHFKNILNQDGILAFSTFSPDNFKEIKNLTGLSLEYKSLQDTVKIFEKDYKIIYSTEFTQTLKFSNPLEILAHMKNTGVNSLGHWTFKEVKDFCLEYKEKYPDLTLTYSPIILICKKV